METLLAARLLMAVSLGFHIIFAAIGMTMPFFMATSYWRYLQSGSSVDLRLTKMWSRGVAILFATGAVSGTVLSFELGLLWPKFMKHAGPIFGMPFSLEGTAFFLEAIFLGIFLYGWKALKPKLHFFSAIMVGVCGFVSGVFVLSANAWMNAPSGFTWLGDHATDIDPIAAMFNSAWLQQSIHMQLAAFAATGFAVAGIHLYYLQKDVNQDLNLRAATIALRFGTIAALLLPLSGHFSAQWVANNQPAKLAAMEALFKTQTHAPLLIGGIPDAETQSVKWGIELPGMLSVLAFDRPGAEVKGLDAFPKDEHPPVLITHFAFQTMVGIGSILACVSLLYWFFRKKYSALPPWLRSALIALTPAGFIALESGWIVTEVGRQPWIIYGIMKTKDSVTEVPGIQIHFALFLCIYLFLAFMCFHLMHRLIRTENEKSHG